jgi:hypothetical protein
MLRKGFAVVGATAVALVPAVPAHAFDCFVAKKPPAAGAVGTFNINTEEFTPSKPNPGTEEQPHGGFLVITDGTNTISTFVHAPRRFDGVLPPVLEGGPQHNCDGKGLDSASVCLGF